MSPSSKIFVLACFFFCPAFLPAEILFKGSLLADGKPVPGATLRLLEAPDRAHDLDSLFADSPPREIARTQSDRAGHYELEASETGFYRLVVEAEGFLGVYYPLMSLDAAATPALFPITLVPARKTEIAVWGPGGEKVAGARIRLAFERDGRPYPLWPPLASTGEGGTIAVRLPQGIETRVWISAAGLSLAEARIAPGSEKLEVRLAKGKRVPVEVFDSRKRPLPGAVLMIPDGGLAIGRTDGEGRAAVFLEDGHNELLILDGEGRRTKAARPAGSDAEMAPWRVELADPPLLTGRVVEVPGGLPIAGAWIYAPGWTPRFTRSDRAGYFEMVMPRTRSERIRLTAAREGFFPITAEASMESAPLTLGLSAATSVEGRVVDPAGRGVAGVQVVATAGVSSPSPVRGPIQAITDRDGIFVLPPLAAGETFGLQAFQGRIVSPELTLEKMAPGPLRGIELTLPQPEKWTCRMVDPEGKPIAQAELTALPARRPGQAELSDVLFWVHSIGEGIVLGRSDTQGKLVVDSLAAGIYMLGARAPGFGSAVRRSVRLGAVAGGEQSSLDAAGELEIELQPAALARGKVVDENGRGIAGAGIRYSLIDPDSPGIFRVAAGALPVALTDEHGDFQFQEVEAGRRIYLLAHKKGYREAALEDVTLGESRLLLTLSRSGGLSGRIFAGGKPRAGLRLEAMPLDRLLPDGQVRPHVQAISEADGQYRLDGFGPGRYRLEVVPPPGFQPFRRDLAEIPGGSEQQLAIELEKAVVVTGRVLLADGAPVEDVSVHFTTSDDEGWSSRFEGRTDNLGRYRIETASPGPGTLRVFSLIHGESSKKVELRTDLSEIDMVLEAGRLEIAISVVGPDGEPLAGADVQIYGDLIRHGKTGADGQLRFGQLRPGTYLVTILKEGWIFPPQRLELKESQSLVWRMESSAESGD